MKLSPHTAPAEPDNLLIRLHNQVGAAVDVAGVARGEGSRWYCHGCGDRSHLVDALWATRHKANGHAGQCRAAFHRLK
ncbi:hypothetical protein ACF1B0_11445 [Streptomyces anandii]|uniref:hypothetical protein n=1 Tax=Streptomyces anandii TaxID=285454 RepID=UPI003702311B